MGVFIMRLNCRLALEIIGGHLFRYLSRRKFGLRIALRVRTGEPRSHLHPKMGRPVVVDNTHMTKVEWDISPIRFGAYEDDRFMKRVSEPSSKGCEDKQKSFCQK
jgi:hypothetical protein